ncbi:DinB family protein [Cytobacillus praedii]|uniref:DinB family protein n=1 Tax=Cytobacillus praedii TaxID=1742358 RepID=A0A4R1AYM3_9BACI|nr:DinB family protein [Cytobacillus praedii]TCJ05698.1 DinB family protein [Cytobacillus praedii]
MQSRPKENEYAPYYSGYVGLVPDGDIVHILAEQVEETSQLLQGISEEQSLFRYASGKWSVKEVIGHVADTERIMAYRLLCIARGETVSLPGFDENPYVLNASFDRLPIKEHIENLRAVRQSTTQLLKGLDSKAWGRIGSANNVDVSVRALAYIIAGHERHHRRLLKERYSL